MIKKAICKKCNKEKVIFCNGKCNYCYNKKYIYVWKINNSEYYKEYYKKNKDKYKKIRDKTISTI